MTLPLRDNMTLTEWGHDRLARLTSGGTGGLPAHGTYQSS